MIKFSSKKTVIFLAFLFCVLVVWPAALFALQQFSGTGNIQSDSSAQVVRKRLYSIQERKSAKKTSQLRRKCLIAVKKKPQLAKEGPCAEIISQAQ